MKTGNRPVLVTRPRLWWYAAALPPIVALYWLAATGVLPAILAPLVLFVGVFWLASFCFAVYAILRKPRGPRQ